MATTTQVGFSQHEIEEHNADEAIIEAGLATFIEVGRALFRIRERRTYLLSHSSFGAYIANRWNFDTSYVYRLIHGASVIDALEGSGADVLPHNPAVAYALRDLTGEPDALLKAWRQALSEYDGRPAARDVKRVLRGEPKPPRRGKNSGHGRYDGNESAEAPDLAALPEPQRTYVGNIVKAAEALLAAKEIQANALREADPETRRAWSRYIRRVRALAGDVATAIDAKL